MRVQRFNVRIAAGPQGHALIVVPFDPDTEWGVKAVHHVSGTVNGCRVRVTLEPGDSGWGFSLNPTRMQHAGIAVGSQVPVELSPEGPQRGDLAEDIAAALDANPAAGAFFDTIAQFYRNGYFALHRRYEAPAGPARGTDRRGHGPARKRDQGTAAFLT
jgi:hypothetical protein